MSAAAYRPGTPAYLDSLRGLVPCVVVAVDEDSVTVDFDDVEKTVHWSGLEPNAWRGRKGERFPKTHVVPRAAVTRSANADNAGATILPYRWVP